MENVLHQLEKRLSEAAHPMIDPVEFGEMKGAVAALQAQMVDFKTKQTAMDMKIDMVLDKLSEARGGWRTLMLLGGAASTLGAAASWIAAHWKG